MVNHMPYVMIQSYLPPGSGDFAAFTLSEAGTRLVTTEDYIWDKHLWVDWISTVAL